MVRAVPEFLPPPPLDLDALRAGRLAQLREAMVDHRLDVCVLTNPVSLRYAVDYRGFPLYQSHIPSTYLMVPVEGPLVLYGGYSDSLETIDDLRPAHSVTAFDAGLNLSAVASGFAVDVATYLSEVGLPPTAVVGLERTSPSGHVALHDAGLRVVDAETAVELARSRKSSLELNALRYSIAVAEHGMAAMEAALLPGINENQLWSILHQVNIAHDGDWMDGRMLCSGPRSNPWYQEASDRTIEVGDLVPFDTDMIGPFGYCADISRTFLCGGVPPTAEQSDLYELAQAEIEHNTALLCVGASFRELSQAVLRQPDDVVAQRYVCAFHGVGMSDEYPKIPYPDDWDRCGYDGEIEDGVVLSVESYVGRLGGTQGVKLEQMVQVTAGGVEALSSYPFWE